MSKWSEDVGNGIDSGRHKEHMEKSEESKEQITQRQGFGNARLLFFGSWA